MKSTLLRFCLFILVSIPLAWAQTREAAAPPTHLVFEAAPANGSVGRVLAPVIVLVEDASGTPVSSNMVTVASSPAGVTAMTTAVNGVATFSSLTFNAVGTYKLTASSSSLPDVTSSSFMIGLPVTVTLASGSNPTTFGQSVTLTATASPSGATGAITFFDGPAILGTRVLSGGTASLTTRALGTGARSLSAVYSGDATYGPAASAPLAQTVNSVPANDLLAPTKYTTGTPFWVAVGDFNGDGKSDIAAANGTANVSVFLGNGDGTFQPVMNYPAGSYSSAVAVGDFNGDGKTDLAVTDFMLGKVVLLLGNGDGTFSAGGSYDCGAFGFSIVVGDFNQDGKADLAIGHTQGVLGVLLGNGDGTFQPAAFFGFTALTVAIGDFNGDGRPDLAAVSVGDNTVGILLGNGDGTFQPSVNYPGFSSPESVVVGDFNQDGKADLAVANETGNSVRVLLGNGNGTFQSGVDYATGAGPKSITTGDFNGDGLVDLFTANSSDGTVGVLLGNGNGTFQPVTSHPAGITPQFLAVGEFNGDGRIDIVVADPFGRSVNVLRGINATQLKFTRQPVNTAVGVVMPPVVVEVQDANGNLDSGFNGLIAVGSAPAHVSETLYAVNGVATFNDLVINAAGIYMLTANAQGFPAVLSAQFTIVTAAPTVTIETPAPGASIVSPTVVVSGWAIDSSAGIGTAINGVRVFLDGTLVGIATYGISRPDVCAIYPGRPGCPNVGFTLTIPMAPGTHTITVSGTDSDNAPDTGQASVTVIAILLMNASRVGVFRNHVAFLEDSNGNQAYDPGVDRFFGGFTGPGGFLPGDVAVTGDWTGDGRTKVGIYRASTGQWFLDANNDGVFNGGDFTYGFGGIAGDVPVVGDWNGVGKSCVGVFRSGFLWVLDLNCNGSFDGTPADAAFPFGGVAGDVPVVGSWTGGTTRVGVVRKYAPAGIPQGNPFYWVLDSAAANAGSAAAVHQPDTSRSFAFGGLAGDVFVVGDWYGTGTSTAGVYRAGIWVLDAALPASPQSFHVPALTFGYGGVAGDAPVVGKW
jgi:hypothetical protein